jgi:hypothetical protein
LTLTTAVRGEIEAGDDLELGEVVGCYGLGHDPSSHALWVIRAVQTADILGRKL